MHEYSIVQALLDQCEHHARINGSRKVMKVTVKIGVLSGVELHLLRSAFETFREDTVCREAELEIIHQKVLVECGKCRRQSTIEKHDYHCPNCGSAEVRVIDGEDMYLMRLEME
jgi:hydrogenase nickel incorporation protein HypA/HybF